MGDHGDEQGTASREPAGEAGGRFELPAHLREADLPWAKTLVAMYADEVAFPTSLSPTQGDFLRSLVANVAPRRVVEIGSFIGISSVWMAQGLEQLGGEGVVHGVDLFDPVRPEPPYRSRGSLDDPLGFAEQAASSAGLAHRIRFHRMESREMARRLPELVGIPIDFLVLDGDHTVRGALDDFLLYAAQLAVGGYVVLHDVNPGVSGWDGPRHLLDHVIGPSSLYSAVEIATTPRNYGLAVVRRVE